MSYLWPIAHLILIWVNIKMSIKIIAPPLPALAVSLPPTETLPLPQEGEVDKTSLNG